jgi:tetratricopeptide (TPR) repeat protein
MAQQRFIFGACLIFGAVWAGPAAAQASHPALSDPTKPPPGTISVDLLRYHLPAKALLRLQEAQRAADAGDHTSAIRRLEETLAKYPDSAAWAQSMLGVQYLKTYQLTAAMGSLDQAVALLPRDAVNRANLGLCLVLTGQYDRAEQELRRALELDPRNGKTQELLDALMASRHDQLARNPR